MCCCLVSFSGPLDRHWPSLDMQWLLDMDSNITVCGTVKGTVHQTLLHFIYFLAIINYYLFYYVPFESYVVLQNMLEIHRLQVWNYITVEKFGVSNSVIFIIFFFKKLKLLLRILN